MTELEKKYGFPLFTRPTNNVYLGNSKKLIISDIWSFWDYIIKKNNFEKDFMNSLLEQAKNFYVAAENSPIKSKPLLYYYSFLNLAKVIVNIEKSYGKTSCSYMHGIGEKHLNKFSNSTITIAEKKNHVKNVACELEEALDFNITTASTTINIKDYLTNCVGIHRAYSEIYNIDEVFVRLNTFKLYKDVKKLKTTVKVYCNEKQSLNLISSGYNIVLEDDIYYWKEEITMPTYTPGRADYYNLSQVLRKKGIWYFIGNEGYTAYLSTHLTCRKSPETIIYNTMFFLGSITRYHPYMFDKIFSDKEQWLMSEFLVTQPKQFIYLATAKILGQNVLKAYSSF
ncbi:hypothetical protein ACVWYN_002763 [Pedobacter sp. UYP24]